MIRGASPRVLPVRIEPEVTIDRSIAYDTFAIHAGRKVVITSIDHPETCRVRYVSTPMDQTFEVALCDLAKYNPALPEYDETRAYWDEFQAYHRAAKRRRRSL